MEQNKERSYAFNVYTTRASLDYWFKWRGHFARVTEVNGEWLAIWPVDCPANAEMTLRNFSRRDLEDLSAVAVGWNIDRNGRPQAAAQPQEALVPVTAPAAPSGYVPFGKALYWAMERVLPDADMLYPAFLRLGHTSDNPYALAFWQFLQTQRQAPWAQVADRVYVEETAAHDIRFEGDLDQGQICFRYQTK